MECALSSPLRAPSLSVIFPGNSSGRASSLHLRQLVGFRPSRCQKMFVPGFGEASPEAKAAAKLQHFFTFVAVKIVLAQLQSYNREAYEELMEFVSHNSLNDGDQFCSRLMRESPRHKGLALRIMEVRSAYSKRDFEWDNLQKLAYKMVDESNTRLMRDYVLETSHIEDK
ncbi:chaperonin-like RBCX protein 1, chloroplastic isoform X2 [Phalaenopsis equestris]|uniref:chaperonin-like RBCX protein 1, chloroplastic isoform X2 n=1 Tax=Phalaenopsis equestris TaxID=78828 RepID=UPI0009E2D5F5|nr:chaperonin-like RBCX protein 1, chloroplastic isoform X2 [Phalaenopsis equestris]